VDFKKMRKVCVITAARSEYGLLKWLLLEIRNDPKLLLQLVVSGSHLSHEFGYTLNEIEKDGFTVDIKLTETTTSNIAKSMGNCMIGISKAFERLNPDIVVILGDRYEILAFAGTALVMNIPIAHISGGDITRGAIDEQIRHAVSKMANIHFPGSEASAKRLIQMGEQPGTVFNVGELGLDSFLYLDFLSRKEVSTTLNIDENQKWVVYSIHPETKISTQKNLSRVQSIFDALLEFDDLQIIVTKSNADNGGTQINKLLRQNADKNPQRIFLFDSLGQHKYLSLLKTAFFMIGNSSSAIFEAPAVPLFAINVGDRQAGRFFCKNILQSDGSKENIARKINQIFSLSKDILYDIESPYGKGGAAKKIKNILKLVSTERLIIKHFYDLPLYWR
jgi:UDP-hydrolysing UDP-N-acetyl-D-glucosamine 2-epimerase